MIEAPKIDERRAPEIVEEVLGLLPDYVDNWPEEDDGGELADALIHVFARFNEIIIDRLNQTPEKNFLAFLDLVGISPLPLQAARAPVTFYLAAGSPSHVKVPARTQIAAPPAAGQQKPTIFETDKELIVVSTTLQSLILKDGGRDRYLDFSAILPPPASPAGGGAAPDATCVPPAPGTVITIPHILYVPLPAYAVWPPPPYETRLKITLDADLQAPISPRVLQWEVCNLKDTKRPPAAAAQGSVAAQPPPDSPIQPAVHQPFVDLTENLAKSGDVVFLNLPEPPLLVVGGVPGKWLRCRLLSPISNATAPSQGSVSATQLPVITSLAIGTRIDRTGLAPDQALFNNLKLDVSKDFFPFGEKPRFGDTFYLASREAFSNPDAALTIHVTVTNPASSGVETPLPAAKPQNTKLGWEFWDGKTWSELGTSDAAPKPVIRIGRAITEGGDTGFSDNTQVLSQSGDISFKFPKPPAELNLNGQKNYWIRVRIIAGDYGKETHFERKPGLIEHGGVLVPATFAPPSIHSVSVDYSVNKESQPETVLTYNDFAYAQVNPQSGPFQPFVPVPQDQVLPSLYFGFTPPPTTSVRAPMFPHYAMSVYVGLAPNVVGESSDPGSSSMVEAWEYWNRIQWTQLTVLDDTQGIRRTGIIRLLPPTDFAPSEQFGQRHYWLRMLQKDPQFQPEFRHVLLNTTMAMQGTTIANEILGASNGTPSQQFRTTQAPVLEEQKVEVRESTKPSYRECMQIQADEGDDAFTPVNDPSGKGEAFQVRWHEVPNFYASDPRDRHYQLDRATGVVTFGDGTYGMIPPAAPGNIRITYRTGGGTGGNQPVNAIAQLKSAIPYVQKATNCEAATGGTDAEPDSALLRRGPLGIRHGGRAVTREDFENLALLASREVARAKCVPLFDLRQDPDARKRRPGVVSLIIVPHATDIRPRPTLDLLDRVRSYVGARRQLTADLELLGPEYVRVDVDCEITVLDPEVASDVEQATKRELDRYLHPVNGGDAGTGWDFGREPKRSDFFGLLESIPGVSHVRELRISLIPDRPGGEKTNRFLICRGEHRVASTLEE